MKIGLVDSYADTENGMTLDDMGACIRSAEKLNEIIVFRSTGPWSKRWLESSPPYPSKNFHVKGKSSDWGPQAGFVPHSGELSKVGHDTSTDKNGKTPAQKGTAANDAGIVSGFAGKAQLKLNMGELHRQRDLACESPARHAIEQIIPITGGDDLILLSRRPGDGALFNFLAKKNGPFFDIYVLPRGTSAVFNTAASFTDRLNSGKLNVTELTPLYVMVSEEAGAQRRPMTGDYDLMAVCPHWGNYMSRNITDISKPAIQLNNASIHSPEDAMFLAGTRLDKVMDMRLHTGARTNVNPGGSFGEHADMGNISARILRAINTLNMEMGAVGANAALRRVHHNAESHRNSAFGALTNADMSGKGDGFPLTAFQPRASRANNSPLTKYTSVATIETMGDFRAWAKDVTDAGYFVPKNWTWGMSIRDTANQTHGSLSI